MEDFCLVSRIANSLLPRPYELGRVGWELGIEILSELNGVIVLGLLDKSQDLCLGLDIHSFISVVPSHIPLVVADQVLLVEHHLVLQTRGVAHGSLFH